MGQRLTKTIGGDGLVAARHLAQYGYKTSVYYPKEGKNELYQVRAPTRVDPTWLQPKLNLSTASQNPTR